MHSYFAYGLSIHSSMVIPEFVAVEGESDTSPDAIVRIASEDEMPESVRTSQAKLSPDEAIITHAEGATFWVREGKEITVFLKPGVKESLIRLYLVGTMMAIVLYQRGLLILHASAVEIDGETVAFSAESGWGKSTTAAAFQAFGHRFIADDVVAIDLKHNKATIFPAFPQLKLSKEVAEVLGYQDESLLTLDSTEEKKGLRVDSKFLQNPLELKHIYFLGKSEEIKIESLPPQEGLKELIRQTLPTRWGIAGGETHFREFTELMKRVPMYRLHRSQDLSSLKDLVSAVKEHLAQVTT